MLSAAALDAWTPAAVKAELVPLRPGTGHSCGERVQPAAASSRSRRNPLEVLDDARAPGCTPPRSGSCCPGSVPPARARKARRPEGPEAARPARRGRRHAAGSLGSPRGHDSARRSPAGSGRAGRRRRSPRTSSRTSTPSCGTGARSSGTRRQRVARRGSAPTPIGHATGPARSGARCWKFAGPADPGVQKERVAATRSSRARRRSGARTQTVSSSTLKRGCGEPDRGSAPGSTPLVGASSPARSRADVGVGARPRSSASRTASRGPRSSGQVRPAPPAPPAPRPRCVRCPVGSSTLSRGAKATRGHRPSPRDLLAGS